MAAFSHAARVSAQPAPRATCQEASASELVSRARTSIQKDPEALGPLLKLADTLVDQGCYADAVTVLEAGQSVSPHDIELSGKLRDVRSLLTEQSYIQGVTQAEDAAKQQHNQLRCTQLADLDACNEALRSNPNDSTLLLARADGLMQKGDATDAAAAYQRALQLNPGNESIRAKLAAATVRLSASAPSLGAAPRERSAAVTVPHTARRARPALESGDASAGKAQIASSGPPLSTPAIARNSDTPPTTTLAASDAAPSYSNDAPIGRSN